MRHARSIVLAAACLLLLVVWNMQQSIIAPIPPIHLLEPVETIQQPTITLDHFHQASGSLPDQQEIIVKSSTSLATSVVQQPGGWIPTVFSYAGTNFGSKVAPPIQSASDPWCAIELMGTPRKIPTATYDPVCVEDPLRQGNFSSIEDLLQFQQLPHTDPSSFRLVTDEERERYWIDNTDPYIAHCRACSGSVAHKTLYRARRWWRMRSWKRRVSVSNGNGWVRMFGSFIGVHRDHFTTRRGSISTSGFTFEPFNETMDLVIMFSSIDRVQLCTHSENGYIEFLLDGGGQIVMQPQTFAHGVRCFWRTLQLLFGDSLATRTFHVDATTCNFDKTLAAPRSPSSGEWSQIPMPRDNEFRFLPCYRNDISNLSRVIEASGTMGKRKNFWPFTCELMRNTDECGQRRNIDRLSEGVNQEIRVAVTLAGFVRSFGSAKVYIYDNIVAPHKATLFGCVWNVVGRAKKTVVINKKMTVRPSIMFNTLSGAFGVQANDTIKRLEVLDYFKYFRTLEVLKANGFLHPGLYFTLVRSLRLVYESNIPFDIVIRTRFDMYAAVPLRFIRMQMEFSDDPALPAETTHSALNASFPSSFEYAINVGSSCMMDGMWWPQYAKFGEGKILKHYADTRMKYFSWQVCDWIDIGTYHTMQKLTTMFDWMVETNSHSAAQFLDHAFFLDHNLTYLPLQLYLKIARHKSQLFG